MAMIGGGEGAFIGPVHRLAAELDGAIELTCGAFSSDPERSRRSGAAMYGLDPASCYGSYTELLDAQTALPADSRVDFVTIVTPNHLHAPIASAALTRGLAVICDKPLTHRLEDAQALALAAAASGNLFAVTYNYTGYPLIEEARALVAAGELGGIRRVVCEYFQGWLATAQEQAGNKQADWRTDPDRAGAAGCFGDIGSHCHNLVEHVCGLEIDTLCADLSTFVSGRRVDDDGNVLLRFSGGAKGTISASQIAVGEENRLTLRVYGEQGGFEWSQQEPNSLVVHHAGCATEVRRAGGSGVSAMAHQLTRLPSGHPEGYLEAFANIYRNFALALEQHRAGETVTARYPGIADGLRGMRFIDAVVRSSAAGGAWVEL